MDRTPASKLSCALSPEALKKQRAQLLPGRLKSADRITEISNGLEGFRLDFTSRPGLLAELGGVIEREHDCCSFLSFNIAIEASNTAVTPDILNRTVPTVRTMPTL